MQDRNLEMKLYKIEKEQLDYVMHSVFDLLKIHQKKFN